MDNQFTIREAVKNSSSIPADAHETSIEVFQSPTFGNIRTITKEDGEPLFCLSDVCKCLGGLNITNVKTRLNAKGFDTIKLLTKGGEQDFIFINESNLYRCILQSRKEEALSFQDWICDEVLPSIRKKGYYDLQDRFEKERKSLLKALEDAQQLYVDTLYDGTQKSEDSRYLKNVILQSNNSYSMTKMSEELQLPYDELIKVLLSYYPLIKLQKNGWRILPKYKNDGLVARIKVSRKGDAPGYVFYAWTERGRYMLHYIIDRYKARKMPF